MRKLRIWSVVAVATGFIALLQTEASLAADSSVPTDFATIQAAIDDVGTVAGDTITVEAGTHIETNVQITKSVTILGTGIGSTTITP